MAKKRRAYVTTRKIATKKKTTTKEGKREYQKRYMQIRRAELRGQTGGIANMNIASTFGFDLNKLRGKRK